MAYVSQEDKKTLSVAVKKVAKKYGFKVSLSVRHHSTLVAKVKGAKQILEGYCAEQMTPEKIRKREFNGYNNFSTEQVMKESAKWGHDVNLYWLEENYCPTGVKFLQELKSAMEGEDFFCEDDSMTDYFHRSHYTDVRLSR
jgi:hypothetical protein